MIRAIERCNAHAILVLEFDRMEFRIVSHSQLIAGTCLQDWIIFASTRRFGPNFLNEDQPLHLKNGFIVLLAKNILDGHRRRFGFDVGRMLTISVSTQIVSFGKSGLVNVTLLMPTSAINCGPTLPQAVPSMPGQPRNKRNGTGSTKNPFSNCVAFAYSRSVCSGLVSR